MRTTKKEMLEGTEYQKAQLIASNTLRIEYKDGTIAIRLHKTDVITFLPNGDIVLNSGEWRTPTTKARMNEFCRIRITQSKKIWYCDGDIEFYDGIRFSSTGRLLSKRKNLDMKKINKKRKAIKGYCALIDKMEDIPLPNGGDCWLCSFHEVKTGETWGDMRGGDLHHLNSHLKEHYIFGSIIYNALKEAGYQHPEVLIQMKVKDSIKRALKKYLEKRFLPDLAR